MSNIFYCFNWCVHQVQHCWAPGYIIYTGVLIILDTTECSSLESCKYPSLSVEILDAECWQTGWETSVFMLVGVSDLWKSWWNRDRKSIPSRAEEEKWLLDCFGVQTFSYCWDQTGDAGMCKCVCVCVFHTRTLLLLLFSVLPGLIVTLRCIRLPFDVSSGVRSVQ